MSRLDNLTKEVFAESFGKDLREKLSQKFGERDLTPIWDHAFRMGFRKALELTDIVSIEELKSFE